MNTYVFPHLGTPRPRIERDGERAIRQDVERTLTDAGQDPLASQQATEQVMGHVRPELDRLRACLNWDSDPYDCGACWQLDGVCGYHQGAHDGTMLTLRDLSQIMTRLAADPELLMTVRDAVAVDERDQGTYQPRAGDRVQFTLTGQLSTVEDVAEAYLRVTFDDGARGWVLATDVVPTQS